MKTSYFFGPYHNDPRAVAISRTVPKGWPKDQRMTALAPPMSLVNALKRKSITEAEYAEIYNWYLDQRDPTNDWWWLEQQWGIPEDEMVPEAKPGGGYHWEDGVILMCWCRPRKVDGGLFCHRRLVAEWFERELKMEVPEAST